MSANAKHDWKKDERTWYGPKAVPVLVDVPEFGFFAIDGEGNPNGPDFAKRVEALYALSYVVKMSPKKGAAPAGYFEYAVYPLEGAWTLTAEGLRNWNGSLDKNELAYTLYIRQPDFVDAEYAARVIEATRLKKGESLVGEARFAREREGRCVQMLHIGPYDSEPASFAIMEAWCAEAGLARLSKTTGNYTSPIPAKPRLKNSGPYCAFR